MTGNWIRRSLIRLNDGKLDPQEFIRLNDGKLDLQEFYPAG